MEIIDAQIHVWERNPGDTYPWDTGLDGNMTNAVTIEDAIVAMDAIGVDAAVLNLPPHYRRVASEGYAIYDNGYAEDAARAYPGRIASAARVDHNDPQLEDRLAETMRGEGVLAIRLPIQRAATIEQVREGAFDRLLKALEDQQVPTMALAQPYLEDLHDIVRRYPGLNLIVDHLGLPQRSETMRMDPEPFQRIEQVLELAKFENVSVKFSGAPTLTFDDYPFADIWPQLHRYAEAFGPERLMWGSDYTRCRGMHNYSEAVNFVRYTDELDASEKELILGKSLRAILNWNPPTASDHQPTRPGCLP